jgi:hypothetical protein
MNGKYTHGLHTDSITHTGSGSSPTNEPLASSERTIKPYNRVVSKNNEIMPFNLARGWIEYATDAILCNSGPFTVSDDNDNRRVVPCIRCANGYRFVDQVATCKPSRACNLDRDCTNNCTIPGRSQIGKCSSCTSGRGQCDTVINKCVCS